MPNSFLKPTVIAPTALGLLLREIVLPRLVWTDAVPSFVGALNDTVSIRVPARRTATKRTLRAGTAIVNQVSHEFAVPVTLDTDIYNGAPITDEELTLDIVSFGTQILQPQVRAIVEGLEDEVALTITGATYTDTIELDEADPFIGFVDARTFLNDNNVTRTGRVMLVGSAVEAAVIKSDRLSKYDQSGSSDALREATIGRMAGFEVVGSNAIPADEAYAFHRTAYVLGAHAPLVPDGATYGQRVSDEGIGMRWIRDYDYTNTTDRSLVNVWTGTAVVEDPDNPMASDSTKSLKRAVKLELPAS